MDIRKGLARVPTPVFDSEDKGDDSSKLTSRTCWPDTQCNQWQLSELLLSDVAPHLDGQRGVSLPPSDSPKFSEDIQLR